METVSDLAAGTSSGEIPKSPSKNSTLTDELTKRLALLQTVCAGN